MNAVKTLRVSMNCIILSSESCLLAFISALDCIIFSSESCLLAFISALIYCFLSSISALHMINFSSDLLSILLAPFSVLNLEV